MIIGRTIEGRPIILNADGSVTTEYTSTESHPALNAGRWTNVPSYFNGQAVEALQALQRIIAAGGRDPETGHVMFGYGSLPMAESAAANRSQSLQSMFMTPQSVRMMPWLYSGTPTSPAMGPFLKDAEPYRLGVVKPTP